MQAPKGPNALHIIGYMNSEMEEEQYTEEGTSSRPNIDVKAIEDQFDNFVHEMQKYDQILSDVAKNIQDIDGQQDFITDFYPAFIWESTYEEEQEKKIVANSDPELARIIQNLERNNKIYKDDMRSWVLEFAKTAKLSEVLISENRVLRQSIGKKNKEIVKLIESIGQAENEEIVELVENLELLKEENGVLKQHLHQLKEEVADGHGEEQRVQSALKQIEEDFKMIEKQKSDAEDEEEHLSKTLELVQQWRNESDRRGKKLEKEKEVLTVRKREYESEKDKIENQLDLCTRERKDLETGLKQEYTDQEAEKYRLMEEIHDLGDLIAKNKSEGRYFEEETTRNLQKKEEYSTLAKKYADKIKEGEEVLKPLSKELEAVQEAEIAVDCQIEMEKYDIEVLRKEFKELEEREKNSQEDCKRVLKRKQEGHDRQLSEWQSKVNQNHRQLAMRILQERSSLSTRQKELQRWQQKVYEKKEQLSDIKSQLQQIKQNQTHLSDLKSKLNQQQ